MTLPLEIRQKIYCFANRIDPKRDTKLTFHEFKVCHRTHPQTNFPRDPEPRHEPHFDYAVSGQLYYEHHFAYVAFVEQYGTGLPLVCKQVNAEWKQMGGKVRVWFLACREKCKKSFDMVLKAEKENPGKYDWVSLPKVRTVAWWSRYYPVLV